MTREERLHLNDVWAATPPEDIAFLDACWAAVNDLAAEDIRWQDMRDTFRKWHVVHLFNYFVQLENDYLDGHATIAKELFTYMTIKRLKQ